MLDFFLKTAKDIFYFFLSTFIATNLNAGSEERSKNRIDAVAEAEEKSSTNWGKVERAKYTFINDAESVEEYEIALAEQKAHEAKRKEDETQKTEEEIEQRDAEYQKFEAERIAEGAPPFTENQKKDRRLQCKSLDLVHRMQKSTARVIPLTPLSRLVLDIGRDYRTDLTWSPVTINLVGEALEAHLVEMFKTSLMNAGHCGRAWVDSRDVCLARRIRK